MSLLLQALQRASKSREGADSDLPTSDESGLSLEPLPEPVLSDEDAPLRSSPSPAQAASVLRAQEAPSFGPLDWAREHYMLTFLGAAILFAMGYGAYVYIQISNPGWLQAAPPAAPLGAGVPPAPQAVVAEAPAQAKISGMPALETPPPATAAAAASAATSPTPPAQAASGDFTARVERAPRRARPVRAGKLAFQPAAEGGAETDADPEVETIEIPEAPQAAPVAPSREEIAVRRQKSAADEPDPTLVAAYEALRIGDYGRAKVLYQEVLGSDPRNIDALLGLAAINWKEGQSEAATAYYARVLEADPRNGYAQAGLIALVGRSDPAGAESRLKQLIAREPSGFLYFTLGNLYAEQGQWPAAQQAYFQAHQLMPENPDYAFNLAVGLEHLGQPKLALAYYRKALDLSFKRGRANFDQKLAIERVGQLSARVD
ncbi:MAG TPA: tetratricopeptide repeat protein [Burkholderiales bacterium]|jgi:tetratricopeptide (TPR) repeat protein|nr:tetratricopeptide repeat protein [Burkholderiales bacterium]